jgi:sulfite exporter TauE/SafE
MAAFGLGNLPVLFGLGLASTRLSQAWKAALLRVGGLLVAGMGAGILWRALQLLRLQGAP